MELRDPTPGMSRREGFGVLILLTIVAFVQLIAARCLDLLYHPLWLDEVITATLVNDPSFTHMLSAITRGVDTHPPTFYIFVWPVARLLGSLDNSGLRIIGLISVLLGMVAIYGICRRFFARGPSMIAMLAIWAHPMVIDQAFQARFYGPWLGLTAWFCLLQLEAQNESRPHHIARWVVAILAATMHYFGAIAIGLILVADFLVHRSIKRILPAIGGLAAVMLCALLILEQRKGLTIPTWIEPVDASQIREDFYAIFGAPSIIFVLMMMWLTRLFQRQTKPIVLPTRPPLLPLLPLTSLLLIPPVLVVFSVVVQPSLVLRYLILSVASLAPMVAWLAEPLGRRLTALTLAGLVGLGAVSMKMKQAPARGFDNEYSAIIEEIDQHVPADGQIVFKRRLDMYPVLRLLPDLAQRSAQLDFDDATIPNVGRHLRFERDMGRKVAQLYPSLKSARLESLLAGGPIYLVAFDHELDELSDGLKDCTISNPRGWVHEVKRTQGPPRIGAEGAE